MSDPGAASSSASVALSPACGTPVTSAPIDVSSVNSWIPRCEVEFKPRMGQIFPSLEAGVDFYSEYAKACGFDIRLGTVKRWPNGSIRLRYCVCSKQGLRASSPRLMKVVGRRMRSITRVDCKAVVGFTWTKDGWKVTRFIEGHSHPLTTPRSMSFMKSSRNLHIGHKRFIVGNSKMNKGPTVSFRMWKEQVGSYLNVGACLDDFKNFYRDLRNYIKDADGQMFVENFYRKKEICNSFFFDYEVDDCGSLTKAFWADPTARKNYGLFGRESTSFDTTYDTNKYSMVFCPFTGIDHHKKCVNFGAGLIAKEDVESFTWLFESFLKAMGGVQPTCMITDQDPAMKIAIANVFDKCHHRYCVWHIMKKLPDKVCVELRSDGEFLKKMNHCVYNRDHEPEEFETDWFSILDEYGQFNLRENTWLVHMYAMREEWVPAYFRDLFLGGLQRTTSRSESENSFFKFFKNSHITLVEFQMRFQSAMDAQRYKQSQLDSNCKNSSPYIKTPLALEKHASKFYTHSVFYELQVEIYGACFNCGLHGLKKKKDKEIYSVSYKPTSKIYEVVFSNSNSEVSCSCKMFNRCGLLCRHCIWVLHSKSIDHIPEAYLLNRWSKEAYKITILDIDGNVLEESAKMDERVRLLGEVWSEVYKCVGLAEDDVQNLSTLLGKLRICSREFEGLKQSAGSQNNDKEMEGFVGCSAPEIISIQNPNISTNKGRRKKVAVDNEDNQDSSVKKRRQCQTCGQIAGHNSLKNKGKQKQEVVNAASTSRKRPRGAAKKDQSKSEAASSVLRLRSSPDLLVKLVNGLSEEKKMAVCNIGFGGLLHLRLTQVDMNLVKWLLDNFDDDVRMFNLYGQKTSQITPADLHLVLGIPTNPSKKVQKISQVKKGHNPDKSLKSFWLSTLEASENKYVSYNSFAKKIIDHEGAGELFVKMFVLFAVSSFLAPTTSKALNFEILRAIEKVDDIKELDWCEFVLDHLCSSWKTFKKEKLHKNSYLCGCVVALEVLYLHKMAFRGFMEPMVPPLIQHWDDKKLAARVKLEKGSFGKSNEIDLVSKCGFVVDSFQVDDKVAYKATNTTETATDTRRKHRLSMEVPEFLPTDKEIEAATSNPIHKKVMQIGRDMITVQHNYRDSFQGIKAEVEKLKTPEAHTSVEEVSHSDDSIYTPEFFEVVDSISAFYYDDQCGIDKLKGRFESFRSSMHGSLPREAVVGPGQLEQPTNAETAENKAKETPLDKKMLKRKKSENTGNLDVTTLNEATKTPSAKRMSKKRKEHGEGKNEYENEVVKVDELDLPAAEIKRGLRSLQATGFKDRVSNKCISFFHLESGSSVAWTSRCGRTVVTGTMLENLLYRLTTDGQVIDFYTALLQRNGDPNKVKNCIFLPSTGWRAVRDGNVSEQKYTVEDFLRKHKFDGNDVKWVFAPIFTKNHWTLLVLDVLGPEWIHYNSLLPRSKKNISSSVYASDARKMKLFLEGMINRIRIDHKLNPLKHPDAKTIKILYSPSCAQQQPTSNDCAMFVCKYISDLITNSDVGESYSTSSIDAIRVQIANGLFTDRHEGSSWHPTSSIKVTGTESKQAADIFGGDRCDVHDFEETGNLINQVTDAILSSNHDIHVPNRITSKKVGQEELLSMVTDGHPKEQLPCLAPTPNVPSRRLRSTVRGQPSVNVLNQVGREEHISMVKDKQSKVELPSRAPTIQVTSRRLRSMDSGNPSFSLGLTQ